MSNKVTRVSLNKSQTNRLIDLKISDLYADQNIIIWHTWTLYTGTRVHKHNHTDCFHRHIASPRM